jgi:putative transposase
VKKDTTNTPAYVTDEKLFDNWFDPIETKLRTKVRGFIEAMLEEELATTLARPRYGRRSGLPVGDDVGAPLAGHRHGRRIRSLTGTFGRTEIAVPRARIFSEGGETTEWQSKVLRSYQRRTRAADALIASAYLSGTNTLRVRRALAALFGGAIGKDTVSRVWRKVKGDWDAWNGRSVAQEPIIRLILDGTVVRVRLDKKSTSISLLIALGVRRDGQKVLLAVKNMGGESEAAWRAFLDDLVKRGLTTPELVIADGAPGLEKALAALWPDVLIQRCTVHKHRNLLAHAPDRLHKEISADYRDMIYAAAKQEVEVKRKAFLHKWRLTPRWPPVWKRPVISSSPLRASQKANGNQSGRRMRSSDYTRNSSAGSRLRPFCRQRKQPRCCSGPCWLPVRSPCGKSTAGRA